MQVQQFLKEKGVAFDVIEHQGTYTAQRMAQTLHVSGDNVAKTVLLKCDDKYVLAVLQATHNIEVKTAREVLGANSVSLASEEQFKGLFPDCELGAVPPFGSQYGLETLVDEPLTKDEEIVFEGNTHHEAIRIKYKDFERLENPRVASFSYHT